MDEIKNQTEAKNGGEPIRYKRDFMKIRFESNDGLSLSKILNIPGMIILVGSVFQEGNKHYPQVCVHVCVCEFVTNYKNHAILVQYK